MLLGQGYRTPRGAVIDEYGAMVECYWQGKTEELGENLSQCHFVSSPVARIKHG
jgi:hypothetical protein